MNKDKDVYLLELNRVMRFYLGGSGLDKWQNIEINSDSYMSEDLSVSTQKYIGPGKPFDEGYSQTIFNGKKIRLRTLIEQNKEEFLGKEYLKYSNGGSCILCRVGDSKDRLVLQYHPTDDFAKKYFDIPFGKTESWYVAATRDEEQHYCYAGFKKGTTKEKFREYFENNDEEAMLSCLNKLPIKQGDHILVKAGTIHAMGGGVTFVEVHQPCDYTMRFERNYMGQNLSDDELHYGIGNDALFDGLDFTTYTEEEAMNEFIIAEKLKDIQGESKLFECISYEMNSSYKVDKLELKGEYFLPEINKHFLMIIVDGDAVVECNNKNKNFYQGRAAFVPYNAEKIALSSSNATIIIAYPFEV